MNVTHKTVSVLAGTIALSVALNYAVLNSIVLPTFTSLERSEAERNLNRISDAIGNELDHLSSFVWDWATWDDSYEFIQDPKNDYIESNLVEPFIGYKLNLILYIDAEGRLVWGEAFDLEAEESIELTELPEVDLSPTHALLQHASTDSHVKGVMLTSRGPMLIASRPIVTSQEEGPIRGSILMGRFLTEEVLEELRHQTKVDFQIWPIDTTPDSPGEREALNQLGTGMEAVLQEAAGDVLAAYSVLRDYADTPAVLLRANTPREITAAGSDTIQVALLGLGIAGVVSLLVMALALQRVVVGPLADLTKHLLQIGASGDLSRRLEVRRGDEIGQLGREFDRMLGQLQNAQRRLSEQSYTAGLAEMASGVLHNIRNQMTPMVMKLGRLQQTLSAPVDDKFQQALENLSMSDLDPARRDKLLEYLRLTRDRTLAERHAAVGEFEVISRQIKRVDEVLSEQERFSRAEPTLEPTGLSELLDEAITLLPDSLDMKLDIVVDPQIDKAPVVMTQRFALKQVLQNLLLNAQQAIGRGNAETGKIEIDVSSVKSDGGVKMLRVEIRDDGCGIRPEHLNRVFERGFTTKGEGSGGTGLHWCANTIANLGGRIRLDSQGAGQGAVAQLDLPVAVDTLQSVA